MFKNASMLTSDSDDDCSTSEEFSINFDQKNSQDFGLGYWINNTSTCTKPPLPCHTSDKLAYSIKSSKRIKSNDISLSSSYQKPKRSKKINHKSKRSSNNDNLQLKSTEIKYNTNDIPRLKIPKHIITNYFKSRSPNYASSSSSSDLSSHSFKTEMKHSKLTSSHSHLITNHSSVVKDSSCLEKSFDKSLYSESLSRILVASHDIMSFTMEIDQTVYSDFIQNRRSSELPTFSKVENSSLQNDKVNETRQKDKMRSSYNNAYNSQSTTNTNILTGFPSGSKRDSLSFGCDISSEETKMKSEGFTASTRNDSSIIDSSQAKNNTTVNARKRSLDSFSDIDIDDVVSTKKKLIESRSENEIAPNKAVDDRNIHDMTPVESLKFILYRLKKYESFIYDKYCLSQPHAMKFLAQNHATNWESNKNDINQMHLVPCEFLNEIFHRALHCFGLEKKIVKETVAGDSSPMNSCSFSHSSEYKKIRDEYSFSLKRVRYGIGVIDELFRRKVNYQNIAQNDDVPIVRKWKHIIYYLCLHAKSAFMAKEIQYHNFVNFASNSFENTLDLCSSNTPSIRCSSSTTQEAYNKPQLTFPLPKDSLKLLESKLNQKITPEHFSQSDFEISPHSYDSGKGSSIRTSSNTNSLVSGCHTTSSLNSTPHSIQDSQPNLPGFQLYRIDEYQVTAGEYIRLLPEALQLHNRIVSKVGAEPNANSRDNMVKLIYYTDVCQQLCKEDLMPACLQRLLRQAVRL